VRSADAPLAVPKRTEVVPDVGLEMMVLKYGVVFVTATFTELASAKTHVLVASVPLAFLKLVVDVTVRAELKDPKVTAKLS
jgi:hypothetical protein